LAGEKEKGEGERERERGRGRLEIGDEWLRRVLSPVSTICPDHPLPTPSRR